MQIVRDGDEAQLLLEDAQLRAHAASPSHSAIAVEVFTPGDYASEEAREIRVYDSERGLGSPIRTFEGGLEEIVVAVVGESVVLAYLHEGAVKVEVDGTIVAVEDASSIQTLVPAGDDTVHLVYENAQAVTKLRSFDLN